MFNESLCLLAQQEGDFAEAQLHRFPLLVPAGKEFDLAEIEFVAAKIPPEIEKAVVEINGKAKLAVNEEKAHIVPVKPPVAGAVAFGHKERLLKAVKLAKLPTGLTEELPAKRLFAICFFAPKRGGGQCAEGGAEDQGEKSQTNG